MNNCQPFEVVDRGSETQLQVGFEFSVCNSCSDVMRCIFVFATFCQEGGGAVNDIFMLVEMLIDM